MDLERRLLSWCYGRLYEVLSFERDVERPTVMLACDLPIELPARIAPYALVDDNLAAVLACDAAVVPGRPASASPVRDQALVQGFGARSRHWVLELPLLDYLALKVVLTCEGEEFVYELTPESAIAGSDASYSEHRPLCTAIANIDAQLVDCAIFAKMLGCYPGETGPIWRFDLQWRAADEASAGWEPEFSLIDLKGAAIPAVFRLFERQTITAPDGVSTHLTYSLEFPEAVEGFLLTATDPTGGVLAGHCPMNSHDYARTRWETDQVLASVDDHPDAYGAWLNARRPEAFALACDRAATRRDATARPLFSVVIALDHPDGPRVEDALETLLAQSRADWELILVDAPSAPGRAPLAKALGRTLAASRTYWGKYAAALGDERVRVKTLGSDRGPAGNVAVGVEAARGQWVVLLHQYAMLEPDALAALAAAADAEPEAVLIYGDWDELAWDGRFCRPVLHGRLNLDLLYSGPQCCPLVALRRDHLAALGPSSRDVGDGVVYDLALRTLAAGAAVAPMPRVLCHVPEDRRVDARRVYAVGRAVLERHFAERGIAATVELEDSPLRLRARYALPEPVPLVSIVIPTRDHLDVLKPCVESLLAHATYPAFEIVLVENHSTDPATFAYYDALRARDGRVSVATWEAPFNYAAVINYGVAAARGDYLLLLNNDTELISPDALETMVGFFARPEVGIVGAKLYFRDRLVQHAGMQLGGRWSVAHVNQNFTAERGGYRGLAVRPSNFSSVTGACQMVPRRVFDEVGGYEEALAFGFNDVDFCLKVQAAGYLVVGTPDAEWYHYEFTTRTRELEDVEELARWRRERDWMLERWPEIFRGRDPYLSPHLDPDNAYYNLPPAPA